MRRLKSMLTRMTFISALLSCDDAYALADDPNPAVPPEVNVPLRGPGGRRHWTFPFIKNISRNTTKERKETTEYSPGFAGASMGFCAILPILCQQAKQRSLSMRRWRMRVVSCRASGCAHALDFVWRCSCLNKRVKAPYTGSEATKTLSSAVKLLSLRCDVVRTLLFVVWEIKLLQRCGAQI